MRTFQRWRAGDGLQRGDGRPLTDRPTPAHALTEAERAEILAVANEPHFAELPPALMVPTPPAPLLGAVTKNGIFGDGTVELRGLEVTLAGCTRLGAGVLTSAVPGSLFAGIGAAQAGAVTGDEVVAFFAG